jgi:uridine phosphorylase
VKKAEAPLTPAPALEEEALIQPTARPDEIRVAPRVILSFTRPDYQLLCRLAQAESPPRYLWDCPLREGKMDGTPLTIVAPAMGAPYAAMVLEKLIALGARMVLALGWCGSLQTDLSVGSLILPSAGLAGDGTSRHYGGEQADPRPDEGLKALLRSRLQTDGLAWHEGSIWTTDAVYRETATLVRHYQSRGVLGVDLELAALLAVGRFRRVPVAALLVVSDELATLKWVDGHRSEHFRRSRDRAAKVVLSAAAQWSGDDV